MAEKKVLALSWSEYSVIHGALFDALELLDALKSFPQLITTKSYDGVGDQVDRSLKILDRARKAQQVPN